MSAGRLVGLIGAVLGPLLVLLLASRALAPEAELRGKAVDHDRAAKARPWDIVVVGASFAQYDIDPELLAQRLGSSQDKALLLCVTASSAPVWYAVLKERVFGNGLKPKLVVLPISIATAMVTRLPPAQMAKLADQMPVPDDVVARRSDPFGLPPALHHALERRSDLRDPLLAAFRDAAPRLLLGQDAEAVAEARALVFREHHERAGSRVLPTVETETEVGTDWVVTDPAQSYLADIVELARANGATVAVVLPPVPTERFEGLRLDAQVERDIEAWARARGVVWLDHRDLGWAESRFKDMRHMRPQTAREFTELIAGQLLAVDAMNGAPRLGELRSQSVAQVSRTGTPPALPTVTEEPREGPCEVGFAVPGFDFLGRSLAESRFPWFESPIRVWEGDRLLSRPFQKGGCTGSASFRKQMVASRFDAEGPALRLAWTEDLPDLGEQGALYWIYPGTTLSWSFAAPVTGASTEARARLGWLGAGAGAAELVVGETRVPLAIEGDYARANLPVVADGPWTLSIASPADGPFLFVHTLELVTGDVSTPLVPSLGAAGLDLLRPDTWKIEGEVPRPPKMSLSVEGSRGTFEVPWRSTTDCSPLRVARDGQLLEGARHSRRQLNFDVPPDINPQLELEVVYDPDRRCAHKKSCKDCADQLWLYPGDVLRAQVPEGGRGLYGGPLRALSLTTAIDEPVPDGATLQVKLMRGEVALLDQELGAEALGGAVRLPLSEPVLPDQREATRVIVRSKGGMPPVLLLGRLEDE